MDVVYQPESLSGKPTKMTLAGKTFYRVDFTRVTEGGNRTERTAITHYDPDSGFLLNLLVTVDEGGGTEAKQPFLNVIKTLQLP